MRSRWLGAGLMALALTLIAARAAPAGTVIYTTAGFFADSGFTSSSTSSDVTAGAASTLSFTGTSQNISGPNLIPLAAAFGTFTLTSDALADTFSETFRLDIFQTFPGAGSTSLFASILGTVSSNPSTGNLVITFGPGTTIVPGGVFYQPDTLTLVPTLGGSYTEVLDGFVLLPLGAPLVPVPPAAYAGLALFGLVGFGKVRQWMAAR
jgi:hypothetical protein